jgi:hypothetical protein
VWEPCEWALLPSRAAAKAIVLHRYDDKEYELLPPKYTIIVHDVEKAFGTVLASICFTSYINPIIPIAGKCSIRGCATVLQWDKHCTTWHHEGTYGLVTLLLPQVRLITSHFLTRMVLTLAKLRRGSHDALWSWHCSWYVVGTDKIHWACIWVTACFLLSRVCWRQNWDVADYTLAHKLARLLKPSQCCSASSTDHHETHICTEQMK